MTRFHAATFSRRRTKTRPGAKGTLRSERGVALLIVLILAAVSLGIMTAMIYMIFSGTQISGMHKKYRTTAECADGGTEMFRQLIEMRGHPTDTTNYLNSLNAFSMNAVITTDVNCTGKDGTGEDHTGLVTKIMADGKKWSAQCKRSVTIDPADATSYDMSMELGTTHKCVVYAKIADTDEGNTGGSAQVANMHKGVVSSRGSAFFGAAEGYLYAIEIEARNAANDAERVKLSILYQY